MSNFVSLDDIAFIDESSHDALPLLDTNWQTTAAVGLSVATGGVTGAIMLAAFPAQTLAAGATIGGLAYAGHRRQKGLDPVPFLDKLSKKADDKAEAVPAAA